MKKLIALILALALAAGLVPALADEEAAVETAAAETEAAAVAERKLLATVNGEEIWNDNRNIAQLKNYYLNYFAQYYGLDVYEDAALAATLDSVALDFAISEALFSQKGRELNVTLLTDEEKTEIETQARADWDGAISSYLTQNGITEESTEEERAAKEAEAVEYYKAQYGYASAEDIVEEYIAGEESAKLHEEVQKLEIGDVPVSEEEIINLFNELVDEDRDSYEGNIGEYEYNRYYQQAPIYYIPEGYRGVIHILIKPEQSLMDAYSDLAARLEEQDEQALADETPEAEAAETPAPEAEAAPAEPTEEPVTQEQVDAARQAVMDSVKDKVEEIVRKFNEGTPFADLIAEYGEDPGMKDAVNLSEGYLVHAESIAWDLPFRDAAMSIENVGGISEPVLGANGVHIVYYLRDVPAGAVDMTAEIRSDLESQLKSDKENAAYDEMIKRWRDAADIQYTADGQAIIDLAAELNAEDAETEEETTAEGAEAPAEEAAVPAGENP